MISFMTLSSWELIETILGLKKRLISELASRDNGRILVAFSSRLEFDIIS
jgi:hypothetical protein